MFANNTSPIIERRYLNFIGGIEMIKQKHIDGARELRLWLTYVVLPAGMIYYSSPDLQHKVKNLKNSAKRKIEEVRYGCTTRNR